MSSNCANLDFFINPNPQPGVSKSFSDVKVVLKDPVTRVILASKLSNSNLYLHSFPLKKEAVGDVIPVDGTEPWIPLLSANDLSFPIIKFCTALDTFYLTGDGGGFQPADFSVFCTNQVDNIEVKQGAFDMLGFTPENVANKDTDPTLSANSDVKYPSQKAVKTYIDSVDAVLQAEIDTKEPIIGFTPENVANKSTNTSLGTSDTLYPSQKAVKSYVDTGLATKENSLGFTPENVANKDQNSGYAGLDSSGKLKASEFPTPTTTTFGGVKDVAAIASRFVTSIVNGVAQLAQAAFSDLSGLLSASQMFNPTSSGIGGIFAGFGACGMLPGSQASNRINGSNNQVLYLRFYVPSKITITKARTAGGATAGTGDFGIYSADGITRYINLGATTYSNNTFTTTTIAQTSVTLDPGWYIFAWTMSDTTKTHFGFTCNSHSNMNQYGSCGNFATAGALPSSLGTLTPTVGSSVNIPVVWFEP